MLMKLWKSPYLALLSQICLTEDRMIKTNTVKVPKLVKNVKFTLEQAMKAQSGSRGIALHFL